MNKLLFCTNISFIFCSYADDAGSSVNEEGTMKKIDDETSANSVKGGYSYKDDDGHEYSVTYTADENGFQPVSNAK